MTVPPPVPRNPGDIVPYQPPLPYGQPGHPGQPGPHYAQPGPQYAQPVVYVPVHPYANPYAAAAAQAAASSNGMAVAAFILGLWGFLTTWIPFGIGLLLGGLPNLLAIIFGIVGIVRAGQVHRGMGLAVTGLILGSLAGVSIFFGAGWLW